MDGKTLTTYLEKFWEIVNDLENLGVKTNDEDLAMLLLYHQPSSYTHFRDTLLCGKQIISFDEVMTSLLSKDRMDSSKLQENGEGLYTCGRSMEKDKSDTFRPRSKSQHRNLTCNYCKKKGHIKQDCYKLQRKLKSGKHGDKKEEQPGTANVAASVDDFSLFAEGVFEDDSSIALLAARDTDHRREEWTIDSACSFHITPHKDCFCSYKTVHQGVVFMGNKQPCKVMGIGNIQIRMKDSMMWTLSDVRYVLDMRRNLISLSALEDEGCSFSCKDGILKITHGQMVVLKGKRKGRLYVLDGDTIEGHVIIAESSVLDEEVTKLWHMRLGHIGDRGLLELNRRGLLGDCNIGKVGFCEHCLFGKQKRVTFISPATHTTKGTLDYVHADVWGPSREAFLVELGTWSHSSMIFRGKFGHIF